MSLTWNEHKAAGKELEYERDYLFKQLIPALEKKYGRLNEITVAAISTLQQLDTLRTKLAYQIITERHDLAGKMNVSCVCFPDLNETEPNCVAVMREEEQP